MYDVFKLEAKYIHELCKVMKICIGKVRTTMIYFEIGEKSYFISTERGNYGSFYKNVITPVKYL